MYLPFSMFSIKSLLRFTAPLSPSILLSFFYVSKHIVFWPISFLIYFYLPFILYFIFSLYLPLISYFVLSSYLPVRNILTALNTNTACRQQIYTLERLRANLRFSWGRGGSARRIKMKWNITSFAKNYEQNGLMFFRYYGKHLHVNSWQKLFWGQQL